LDGLEENQRKTWKIMPLKCKMITHLQEKFNVEDIPNAVVIQFTSNEAYSVLNDSAREKITLMGAAGFPWKAKNCEELDSTCFSTLEKHPALVLFYDGIGKEESKSNEHAHSLRFFYAKEKSPFIQKIRKFTGIATLPVFCILNLIKNAKYKGPAGIGVSFEQLDQFVKDFKDGALRPFLRSESIYPEHKDTHVPGLYRAVADNIEKIIIGEIPNSVLTQMQIDPLSNIFAKFVLIHVHSESSPASKEISKQIARLCQVFESEAWLVIFQYDADKNDINSQYFPEPALPILKLFIVTGFDAQDPAADSQPYLFSSKVKNAEAIIDFIRKSANQSMISLPVEISELKSRLKQLK
jgi:hypothetical protein